jgi:hypothetical protein
MHLSELAQPALYMPAQIAPNIKCTTHHHHRPYVGTSVYNISHQIV